MPENEHPAKSNEFILGDWKQVSQVHLNVSQDLIVITEDKLRIHLTRSRDVAEKRKTWITPLGIFLALLLPLGTANFKDFILKGSTWEAMVLIGVIASVIWLIYELRTCQKSETIDQLIERIKKEPH